MSDDFENLLVFIEYDSYHKLDSHTLVFPYWIAEKKGIEGEIIGDNREDVFCIKCTGKIKNSSDMAYEIEIDNVKYWIPRSQTRKIIESKNLTTKERKKLYKILLFYVKNNISHDIVGEPIYSPGISTIIGKKYPEYYKSLDTVKNLVEYANKRGWIRELSSFNYYWI